MRDRWWTSPGKGRGGVVAVCGRRSSRVDYVLESFRRESRACAFFTKREKNQLLLINTVRC